MNKNPEIDKYIAKSADFAQPILVKLRKLVHLAHPEIEESIKWGMPYFEYKGLLFGMAAFKQHCSFGFWKQDLIKGIEVKSEGMGAFGKIKSNDDLPSDEVILKLMKEAIILNENGINVPKPIVNKQKLAVPDYLKELLNKNPNAKEVFENFAPSHQKEYLEWIIEAKREATREKRLVQMIGWLEEGKRRNWKYENC